MALKEIIRYDTWLYARVLYEDGNTSYFVRGEEYKAHKNDHFIDWAVNQLLKIEANQREVDLKLVLEFRAAIRENDGHQLGFSYYRVKTIEQARRFIDRVWKKEMANRERNKLY